MKISDLLQQDLIFINKKFTSKEVALKFFSKQLQKSGYASSATEVHQLFLEREQQVSTGVGDKIAMPHIRNNVMQTNKIFFAQVQPLDWQSPDGQKVKYIIGIAMNEIAGQELHLEIIASLSKLLINSAFVAQLAKIKTKEEVLQIFTKFEKQLNAKLKNSPAIKTTYDLVAVTACPTGIAHTFMAAERLEKVAAEKGILIKVETQGTLGAKNALTKAEIENAKGVILALDRSVDTGRFKDHDNVLETSTRKAIHDTERLLEDALNDKGNKLKSIVSSDNENAQTLLTFDGFMKKSYRSVLTGISYMLPFVIFGGILIALAFLIDLFYVGIVLGNLEKIDGSFGSMTATSSWFKTLGGSAFGLMIPILSAYITYAIVGKMGLLPGFIVGLMASGSMNEMLNAINLSYLNSANSGFFGAIGGAFLAAAILIAINMKLKKLPKQWLGIFNILVIPVFGTLFIASVFWFANIPFQFLNQGFTWFLELLNSNSQYIGWLLGLLIGIMMAIDLGGPINKAAYVFGTTSLATVLNDPNMKAIGSIPMAAAIIAGMVPPLAIAVSTLVSKKYWTSEQRKSAQTNWVLGFSFISEGAIPFTAAKPKAMVPANIIGGGVAGLFAGLLGVGALAPHGGIFILPFFRTNLFSGAGSQFAFGMIFMLGALIMGVLAQVVAMKFLLPYDNQKISGQKKKTPKTIFKIKN